jgi:hypothetical protein
VLPPKVQAQVDNAKAVSANLRSTASEFPNTAPRLTQAAQTIDVLVSLVEVATFSAELNKQTIAEMQR